MPKYFGQDMPSISNLEKRTALAFTASNPVIDELGPLSENIIPVGGIHIRNAKPLPQVNPLNLCLRNNFVFFYLFRFSVIHLSRT